MSFRPADRDPAAVPPVGGQGFVLGPDEGDAYWWLGTLSINKLHGRQTAGVW